MRPETLARVGGRVAEGGGDHGAAGLHAGVADVKAVVRVWRNREIHVKSELNASAV